MAGCVERIRVRNYRCLKAVEIPVRPVNVLFGPSGVGKSTLLDALWFVRDVSIRGTLAAAADRHHGIGALWDRACPGEVIEIALETPSVACTMSWAYADGRLQPYAGERLWSRQREMPLIDRPVGAAAAAFCQGLDRPPVTVPLTEPDKPAFNAYLATPDPVPEALELREVLWSIHLYASRNLSLHQLRRVGSERSPHTFLYDRWQNLWSALHHLHDRQAIDGRYNAIMDYMRRAYPDSFRALVFQQADEGRVTASLVEHGRLQPIQASGMSDGQLQLLGLLTALFGESPRRYQLLMFDEPGMSLHTHAVRVFAEAVRHAASHFNRQVIVATPSTAPVSAFGVEACLVLGAGPERETLIRRPADDWTMLSRGAELASDAVGMIPEAALVDMTSDWTPH